MCQHRELSTTVSQVYTLTFKNVLVFTHNQIQFTLLLTQFSELKFQQDLGNKELSTDLYTRAQYILITARVIM